MFGFLKVYIDFCEVGLRRFYSILRPQLTIKLDSSTEVENVQEPNKKVYVYAYETPGLQYPNPPKCIRSLVASSKTF